MDDFADNLVMRKSLLRHEMKKRRAGLAAANPFAGDILAELSMAKIIESIAVRIDKPLKNTVIAGYWPIQSEISPFPLMQALEDEGYSLALPCLVPQEDGYRMIFRAFVIGDVLISGPFDIRQPSDAAPEVTPDIILLPLLAFDEAGIRLGYGGGYYDRALCALRKSHDIKAYGVAFSGQQLAEIPFEVHDQPLDGIVTERGVVETRAKVAN
jgi:5-formyltetrahydrofolate cyclo-ligase